MDKTAFQQLVKRLPVEPFCAAGCRTLEIYRQVLKGGMRGQRADTPAGHTDGEYILMHDGKLLNKDAFNRWLKKYCIEAGITPRSSHKIRFTVASLLYSKGVPLPNLQQLLGHTNISHDLTLFKTCNTT